MSGQALQEHTFVRVLYDFQYKTTEGREIAIKKNEKLYLLQKTNADWWQVVRTWEQRSFYVPATYVKEMSRTSRKSSEEDKDTAPEPLDGPKYKNMPKETSSAMKNVRKWLAGAMDSKHESFKTQSSSDESHKHNAMDYAARAELKIGLAAIKTKSLERDRDQINQEENARSQKRSSEIQKKLLPSGMRDQDSSKASKYFSTSPKSFDMHTKMEMSIQDPFRKELENSLDRIRKKSDSINHNNHEREVRKNELFNEQKILTKSSHSDDSHIDSDIDERYLSCVNDKSKKIDKPESKMNLSLHEELSNDSLIMNKSSGRISRSLDNNVKYIGKRTERSLSPKPTYGHQLTIAEGEITDEELDPNTSGDHKILNDKRRTWAVEELMSELTQMCRERVNNKKSDIQLKSTEIKTTFDPLDELTKELHEMNLLRSGDNTPQVEKQPIDIKLTNTFPSNVCKILIKSENKTAELNGVNQPIKKHDESKVISHNSNISGIPDLSDDSVTFCHSKNEKQSAFTFHTSEETLTQTKSLKSPKSPKILDEYNEANILNDCSSEDLLSDAKSLSHDKQSGYHKCITKEICYISPDNDHEAPSYSNIKLHQINKVKMRPKIQTNMENSSGELKLTPSLEKLANEIQFLPANRVSYVSEDKSTILNECISDGDNCNDSGIHDGMHKYNDCWSPRTVPIFIKYAGSFKTKREGRYFHRHDNSDLDDDDDDDYDDGDDDDDDDDDDYVDDNDKKVKNYNKPMTNAKICGLKKSTTLHYITIPDNYRRFRTHNDLASIRSKSFKRQSRSLTDLRCFDEENITESYNVPKPTKTNPVPLPRKKLPTKELSSRHEDKSTSDNMTNDVNQIYIPMPRKINESKIENSRNADVWKKFNKNDKLQVKTISNVEINIESSTAVGFKSLLCTSESGSDNCLQSKDILSHNNECDGDNMTNQVSGKYTSSAAILNQDMTRRKESPTEEQILSSNASSEALQSQSESEVTVAFDASSQPSPVNTQSGNQDGYQCTIQLPPGWSQKYDLQTDQICFVNEHGDRWFSSNDDEGKIYFFEENSNESSWVLPTILPDKSEMKTSKQKNNYSEIEDDSSNPTNEFSQPKYTSSSTSITNQSIIDRDVSAKKSGASSSDWPQLSFDGNMRILKEGPISRTKITENGKKLRKNWNTSYAVLTELFLLFFKDSKTFSTMMKSGQSPIAKPDISVDLNGALVEPGETASSRKNVYRISTVLGLQVLIQSDNTSLATEWFHEIHGAIRKLPLSFQFQVKQLAGPPEMKKISSSKLPTETSQPEDYKKISKVTRSRSMKMKRLDDSLEDLSGTVAERQTKIKAKLRRFFLRRPTVESLVKDGIYKDEPAFGSYLKDVCPPDYPRVPLFVKTCIEVLESNEDNMKTDGLYRASGNLSQIQKIRLQIDQYNLKVLSQEEDVHVLTGALKLFFRELKEPLIPSSFFEDALNASMLKKTSTKIQCFREIIKALPPPNHDTLQFLLKHLLKVTSYQEFNRMHIPNLAIVFGPTLMWPAEESANMALDLMQQNLVIECLLSEYNKIFK